MTILQHNAKITTDCYDLLNLGKYFMIPTGIDTDGTNLYSAYVASLDKVIDFIGELPLAELICQWAVMGISMDAEDQDRLKTYLDNYLDFGAFDPAFEETILGSVLGKRILFSKVGSNENHIFKSVRISESKKPKPGFMYVIQLDGCIKVGFSTDVKARMQQFESTSMRVDLLHKVPALLSQEKEFHKLFNNKSEKYRQSATSIIKIVKAYLNNYEDLMTYLRTHKGNASASHFDLALSFADQL